MFKAKIVIFEVYAVKLVCIRYPTHTIWLIIRWLGHVSVETTNIYAEVNLEMKARALLNCEMKAKKSKKHWRDDKSLMAFLDSL